MNLRSSALFSADAATPVAAPASADGTISPQEAWDLVQAGTATLLDVRTVEERAWVGRVPGSAHVAWATGTALNRNPHFPRQVQALLRKEETILLLCRSGNRSAAAAEVLRKAGFSHVLSIREGFEGARDADGHRGTADGWRHHDLPWEQD